MNKKNISIITGMIIIIILFFFYLTGNKESDTKDISQTKSEHLESPKSIKPKKLFEDKAVEAVEEVVEVVEKVVEVKAVEVVKSKYIFHFGFNKSEINDSENLDTFLSDLDLAIKEKSIKHLTLSGYTDSIGSKKYNKSLSYKRVHTFGDKFKKYDISIKYVYGGETNPIASNKTEEGRAKNRRVEILLGL